MEESKGRLRDLLKDKNPPAPSIKHNNSIRSKKALHRQPVTTGPGAQKHPPAPKKGLVYLPLIDTAAAAQPPPRQAPSLSRLFERCEGLVFRRSPCAAPREADSIDLGKLSLHSPRDAANAAAPATTPARESARLLPSSGPLSPMDTASGSPAGESPRPSQGNAALCSRFFADDDAGAQQVVWSLPPLVLPPTPAAAPGLGTQYLEDQMTYSLRAQADTEALLASCPAHLRRINAIFLKQAQAFEYADSCNAAQPLLPRPATILSALAHVEQCAPARPLSAAREALLPAEQQGGPEAMDTDGGGGGARAPPAGQPSQAASPAPPWLLSAASPHQSSLLTQLEEAHRQRTAPQADIESLLRAREAYRAVLQQFKAPPAAAPPPASAQQPAPPPVTAAAASAAEEPAATEPPPRREEAVLAFCVERPNERTGAFYRNFVAASYSAVWSVYLSSLPTQLHWYEVIREGRPCHLYFDLEYPARLNPGASGDALVDALLRHVGAELQRNFGLDLDPAHVFELDSTTPDKFSRHLVVHLPGHAFFTNHAAGQFVAAVLAASGDDLNVMTEGAAGRPPVVGSFVDTAVYSRNRHFRLAYSSKGGKSATLRPTGRFATAPGPARPSPAKVFQEALICRVAPSAALLLMRPPFEASGGVGGREGEVVAAGAGGGRRVAWKRAGGEGVEAARLRALEALAEDAVGFIESAATRRGGGKEARARTVAFCGCDGLVAYSMIGPGSHHCENVGRPHTSNHVYFVANFQRGMFAQKCHDPRCAGYRSAWMPLPKDLCLASQEAAVPPAGPQADGGA